MVRRGPWKSALRREGYIVMAGDAPLLHTDATLPRDEQRDLARAVAALPDLLELLADVEDYLGDRPASDLFALNFHGRATKILAAADVKIRSA